MHCIVTEAPLIAIENTMGKKRKHFYLLLLIDIQKKIYKKIN